MFESFRDLLGILMNIYILAMIAFVSYNFLRDTNRVIYWKRHNLQRGESFGDNNQS